MKFLIWSDLHQEFYDRPFDLPPELESPVDAILIQGDTHTKGRHLEIPRYASLQYEAPAIAIWGNHELYNSSPQKVKAMETEFLERHDGDVEVLNPGVRELDGARIIGCTLWTDLQLYPELFLMAKDCLPILLNDCSSIRVGGSPLTMERLLAWHHRDREFLHEELRKPYKGKTIVMTHHLPVRELIAPEHLRGSDQDRVVSMGFASDLWKEFREYDISLWLCGHSHSNLRWVGKGKHGMIPFLMNQRGYPVRSKKNDNYGAEFNPEFVVEIEDR